MADAKRQDYTIQNQQSLLQTYLLLHLHTMTNTQPEQVRLAPDYVAPATNKGSYFKPTEEKTKIRVLGSPITGYVDWDNSKPVRTKEKPAKNFNDEKPAKHFRAFPIWNYNKQEMQIWEVTQASIREQFTTLINGEWGDPRDYDLVVYKTGKDLETKYFLTTTPDGKKEVSPEITQVRVDTKLDLNQLYTGGNPRNPTEEEAKF